MNKIYVQYSYESAASYQSIGSTEKPFAKIQPYKTSQSKVDALLK